MFYYLPQGWPLYQKIDTLFRRITWQQHAVHSQLQGPVTDFGLQCISSCWHALPYKWLPRRGVSLNKMSHKEGGGCLTPLSASVPRVFPLSPHLTPTTGVNCCRFFRCPALAPVDPAPWPPRWITQRRRDLFCTRLFA